ncbi:hypothetical protein JB92DRAFT_1996734 [Gautieria morchelliformis]|nr:hypothetical protein JB92DRAFT_1996734 [Gautieria morchelliformis]
MLEEYQGMGIMSMITDVTRDLAKHVRILHLDFRFPRLDLDANDLYEELACLALRRCLSVERLVLDHWREDHWGDDGWEEDEEQDEEDEQDEEVAYIEPCARPWDLRMVYNNSSSLMGGASGLPYMTNVTHFYYGVSDFFRDQVGLCFSDFFHQITHLAVFVTESTSHPRDIPDMQETLKSWLSRRSLQVFYVEYVPWTWSRSTYQRNFLEYRDPEVVWEHLLAVEDQRFFMGSGLQTDLECVVKENGKTVWERVSPEPFEGWKENVRRFNELISTDA